MAYETCRVFNTQSWTQNSSATAIFEQANTTQEFSSLEEALDTLKNEGWQVVKNSVRVIPPFTQEYHLRRTPDE